MSYSRKAHWFTILVFAALVPLLVIAAPAAAQATRTANLQITVLDQTNAVLPGATVTIVGSDGTTKATTIAPVQTSPQGVAVVPNLAPGVYTIQAEFPGFETRMLRDVRIRAGDNKQVLVLPIAAVKDAVTVEQGKQEAASDPRGPAFGTTLTREQLEALSDDPNELRRQLQEMAGPGAVIKVDSFEGAALPPKAQIRSIRISRDQFAAENHSAGGLTVEIITQPGLGPVRYQTGFRFRDGAFSGRSPFASRTPPEQIKQYFMGLQGALIKDKSSFGLFMNGMNSFDTPLINAAFSNGTRSEVLRLRTPRDNVNINAQVDYALTLDQTLRFAYNVNRNTVDNLGIGAYDEESRAYATENTVHNFRAQHMGPVGRRAFSRSRLQFTWNDNESQSRVEQPTIRVNDAFTLGGAQVAGGQHSRVLNLATDYDYVRSIHTVRTGLAVDLLRVHADDTSNYLGTYTFESLAAYEANRPRSYTRRIGDPDIAYTSVQGAWYVQDDVRVRRNLTLSAGARYEAQTHVSDYNNLAPRVGFTWAPLKSGATTLRASWGTFYDWMLGNTYEQTLRVDGVRQQEINILDPTYPDVPAFGASTPVARYLLGNDVQLPRNSRVSLGVDQRLARRVQSNVTYSHIHGATVWRGVNLNQPVGGVRPQPQFGNIIEVFSDAESRQHQVATSLTVNPGALLPAFNAPRIDWKRVTVFFNHTLGFLDNNSDGPFVPPPGGSLLAEWGPGGQDIRHRLNVTVNNQIVRNLLMNFNVNYNSGAPYTIRTGFDDNGDLIFNDRPFGVDRNSLRGASQWSINPAMAYTFTFGRNITSLPPGVGVIANGAAPTVVSVDQSGARFRLQLVVQAQNITNHANYGGYSGTLTSPFYGRPTLVNGTTQDRCRLQLQLLIRDIPADSRRTKSTKDGV
jgi:hypothetical protein